MGDKGNDACEEESEPIELLKLSPLLLVPVGLLVASVSVCVVVGECSTRFDSARMGEALLKSVCADALRVINAGRGDAAAMIVGTFVAIRRACAVRKSVSTSLLSTESSGRRWRNGASACKRDTQYTQSERGWKTVFLISIVAEL